MVSRTGFWAGRRPANSRRRWARSLAKRVEGRGTANLGLAKTVRILTTALLSDHSGGRWRLRPAFGEHVSVARSEKFFKEFRASRAKNGRRMRFFLGHSASYSVSECPRVAFPLDVSQSQGENSQR